ncbi:F-box domain-containing protein [Rhynchospora pubera]|uniref:F-box domain-containing protein n=1 Tax=Rhynchospora pubera TaxID=906938 RepID=A0AAV8CES2_9POAL|nr:F-box domain-containing protein [Rhynchospora pubera]
MCDESERERERERKMKRDWSDIPLELVHAISKRIPGLCDFVSFRAAYKKWHSSIPLSDAPPQLPWLLEGNVDGQAKTTNLQEQHRFYSLFTDERGTIYVKPSCQGKRFRGPSHGHLLLCKTEYTSFRLSSHLFNPLTDEEFLLPPQPSPTNWQWQPVHNCGFESWAFYDARYSEWIAAERRFSHSCAYLGGLIFSSRGGDCTEIFNVSGLKVHEVPPLLEEMQIRWPPTSYLIESDGGILRVSLYLDCSDHSYFRIYKLMHDETICFWEETSNIGDQVLFLDVADGFSMSATSFPDDLIKCNSIYFLYPDNCQPYRYDIQQGSMERLLCPFKICTWFVPTLNKVLN